MIGVDLDIFKTNNDLQDIVCFNILQIGELVKTFEKSFLEKNDGIPWDKIAKMRDIVAHRYGTIKIDDVYRTTILDIEPLEFYCKEILNEKITSQ